MAASLPAAFPISRTRAPLAPLRGDACGVVLDIGKAAGSQSTMRLKAGKHLTMPFQLGDVVYEGRPLSGPIMTVRPSWRTLAVRGMGVVILSVSLWLWKVQGDADAGQLLALLSSVFWLIADRWVDRDYWLYPTEATDRRAYRRLQMVENALWIGLVCVIGGFVLFTPDGSLVGWAMTVAAVVSLYAVEPYVAGVYRRVLRPARAPPV
jgi:hypothetical protein